MISVWNRQHVSDRQLLFATICLWLMATGPAIAEEDVPVAEIRLTVVDATGEMARFIEDDRRWLQRWPVTLLAVPPPDSLSAVRGWVTSWMAVDNPQSGGVAVRQGSAEVEKETKQAQGARSVLSLLRDRWFDRGYLVCSCRLEGTVVDVDPGPRFRIEKVNVDGVEFPGRSRLLADYLPRAGSHFEPAAWEEAVDRILVEVGQAGRPFVSWMLRDLEIDPEAGAVVVNAILFPGPVAHIGPITNDLPNGRGSSFLTRATGLRSGDLFRQRDLARARQRLKNRQLYTEVGMPVVYRTTARDTVGIFFPVVPVLGGNRLSVILGFSQGTAGTESRLSGQIDLDLPNLAGSGRKLAVAWSDDGRDKTHFGFGYTEPLAFGTPLDASVLLDQEVLRDRYTRFRIDQRWQMSVVANWAVEVGVGWDRSTYPSGDIQSTRRMRGRGAFLRERGSRRESGWACVLAVETGSRTSIPRSGSGTGSLGTQERQQIYEVDLNGEIWLADAWSIAGRSAYRNVGAVDEVVPLTEQYRFGGATTLRGYREEEFHGSETAFGSVELRIGRPGRSRLYTFYDIGYFVFNSLESAGSSEENLVRRQATRRGFGVGLETQTPGGDISLAIGIPEGGDFDAAKLHVALRGSF